jgi:hypothetical protein
MHLDAVLTNLSRIVILCMYLVYDTGVGIFWPTWTLTHQIPGPSTRVQVSVDFLKGTGMGSLPTGIGKGWQWERCSLR